MLSAKRDSRIVEDDFRRILEEELKSLQQQTDMGKTDRKSQLSPVYAEILEGVGTNEFHGYDATEIQDAKVVAILDGDRRIQSLGLGEKGSLVLDRTPFYAESGGQVGDIGTLNGVDQSILVTDTYSPLPGLIIHKVTVRVGSIAIGDTVTATVDAATRDATRRNHTATHLVHAA